MDAIMGNRVPKCNQIFDLILKARDLKPTKAMVATVNNPRRLIIDRLLENSKKTVKLGKNHEIYLGNKRYN